MNLGRKFARNAQLVARYEAGETTREIAESIGLTHTAVRNILLRAGVTFRPPKRRPKEVP